MILVTIQTGVIPAKAGIQ